jgi:hypothetical protein
MEVAFGHLAASYYVRNWQFNGKLTAVREVNRSSDLPKALAAARVPQDALTLQVARYMAVGMGERARVMRVELTWRISHYAIPRRNLEQGTWTSDKIYHEFGAEWAMPAPHNLLGSLTYTFVGGEDPKFALKKKPSRLAYVLRTPDWKWHSVFVQGGVAAGVLGDGFHFGELGRLIVQPNLSVALPVGQSGINLNMRYAPAFQRLREKRNTGYAWNQTNEVALFLDVAVRPFTRLRLPSRRE